MESLKDSKDSKDLSKVPSTLPDDAVNWQKLRKLNYHNIPGLT